MSVSYIRGATLIVKTMNFRKGILSIAGTLMLATLTATAQIQTPRPSPLAEVEQKLALTEIEVTYSRPGMKGRKIFGDLVPFGELWRTGANAITTVEIEDDVTVNGRALPAGTYALLTIPGEKEWTVIFSKDSAMGGVSDYKKENDAARIMVRPRMLREPVETFTIGFHNLVDDGGTMSLQWENTSVDIDIRMDIDSKIMAAIRTTLLVDGTTPKASDYHSAAVYYMERDRDLPQALKWMEKSVEMRPEAFWYVHRHAELLGKMGRKDDALAAANKSLQMAKENKDGDFGYVKRNEELIAKLKGG